MALLRNGRIQARLSLALAGGAVALPTVVQVVAKTDLGSREIVQVEFAGSGEKLLALAGASPERLELFRSLLGRRDDFYVAMYGAPLVLGADLLPGVARGTGMALTLGTVAADIVENHALERALRALLRNPGEPGLADRDASLARKAAAVKFALLVPAIGLSIGGALRCVNRRCTGE